MWSGFSSEIETGNYQATYSGSDEVACGAASHLRLKRLQQELLYGVGLRRMWSGFSSEIETVLWGKSHLPTTKVACGAASHLRLKRLDRPRTLDTSGSRMWSGFSSEIETRNKENHQYNRQRSQ